MVFITSRQPTNNIEPALNKHFVFDLENSSSSRGFFCCRRIKKDVHEEIGSKQLLSAIKEGGFKFHVQRVKGDAVAYRLPGAWRRPDMFSGAC